MPAEHWLIQLICFSTFVTGMFYICGGGLSGYESHLVAITDFQPRLFSSRNNFIRQMELL
jgi:hypothetical protein